MNINIIPATQLDLPIIQKMWPFYVYDLSRECGFNKGWESPTDLSFVPDDLSPYFNDPKKLAFLIEIDNELAGFVLLNMLEMSEFYIIAKYQGKGLGKLAAQKVWDMFPGAWRVPVIPENKQALAFWRSVIEEYTAGKYQEEEIVVDSKAGQFKRIIFSFIA